MRPHNLRCDRLQKNCDLIIPFWVIFCQENFILIHFMVNYKLLTKVQKVKHI